MGEKDVKLAASRGARLACEAVVSRADAGRGASSGYALSCGGDNHRGIERWLIWVHGRDSPLLTTASQARRAPRTLALPFLRFLRLFAAIPHQP